MARRARKAQAPALPARAFQDDALLSADAATQNHVLDQMRRAGAHDLRLNAIWGQVRKNGAYDWSHLDTLANAARARGIHPQLTLTGTPRYMAARNVDMGLSADTPNQNLMGRVRAGRCDALPGAGEAVLDLERAEHHVVPHRG
jgi:hypothetical protein